MHGNNLVAVYHSRSDAERVRQKLISDGFSSSDIRLSGDASTQTTSVSGREEPGFFEWLFGDVSDREADVYQSHVRENRTIVSVRVVDERLHQRALDIMEELHPIDLDDQSQATLSSPTARSGAATVAEPRPTGTGSRGEREQVIPVVKEELSVGKRASERHYRVKTYVIERPVQEQVMLRDERVEIEHRPVSGAAARSSSMPQQREIDVVERHEEPVVEKRGRTTEEVVVRKEVTERPETVRGTVRETKVDVDKEPTTTEAGPAGSRANPTAPRR
jgi:hypothetical protein